MTCRHWRVVTTVCLVAAVTLTGCDGGDQPEDAESPSATPRAANLSSEPTSAPPRTTTPRPPEVTSPLVSNQWERRALRLLRALGVQDPGGPSRLTGRELPLSAGDIKGASWSSQ
jgi:hypothetical protein